MSAFCVCVCVHTIVCCCQHWVSIDFHLSNPGWTSPAWSPVWWVHSFLYFNLAQEKCFHFHKCKPYMLNNHSLIITLFPKKKKKEKKKERKNEKRKKERQKWGGRWYKFSLFGFQCSFLWFRILLIVTFKGAWWNQKCPSVFLCQEHNEV